MPFCSDQIFNWATTLWYDLNSPSNVSLGYLSGWLSNSGTLGDINNRLGTCFWVSGDAPCIVDFTNDEGSIANAIYQITYYRNQRLGVLKGGVDNAAQAWTTIKEGDSTISRDARANIAREFGAMQREAEEKFRHLLSYYTLNHTVPQGINAANAYSFPSPN